MILAAFFPMFVLAWVLMSVFAAPYDLNSRTANIGVVLMAYVSFIPVLRSNLPPVPYYTMLDYALYSNLLACIIVLFASVVLFQKVASIKAQSDPWSDEQRDRFELGTIIVSAFFLFIPYVIVFFFTLHHYIFRKKGYDQPRVSVKKNGEDSGEERDWRLPEVRDSKGQIMKIVQSKKYLMVDGVPCNEEPLIYHTEEEKS